MKGTFTRIVTIHTGEKADDALIEHAGMLAAKDETCENVIAALPAAAAALSLREVSGSAFAAPGARNLSIRPLSAPDVNAVLQVAAEHGADLLVVRNPRDQKRGRVAARRLLASSPCAVCFVPPGRPPAPIRRIVVGVDLTTSGADLVERMAHFCAATGVAELLVVHSRFRETLAWGEEVEERFRDASLLEVYRFLSKVPRAGTRCTPLVAGYRKNRRAILAVALERETDLVVVGRSASRGLALAKCVRQTLELLWDCPVPLLQLPARARKRSFLESLWKSLFVESEPRFN